MSINQALASSISQIVDDRLKNSFEIRDNVLSQMHQSLEAVASLLRGKLINNYVQSTLFSMTILIQQTRTQLLSILF